MKKISIYVLGLLFSASSYAQTTPATPTVVVPYAPKSEKDEVKEAAREGAREGAKEGTKNVAKEAKAGAKEGAKEFCAKCTKPKPTPKPKPVKPKPAPAPAPAEAKKCPEPRPCPKCEPEIRTVEKEKVMYRDRTVTIDKAPKNSLNLLVGVGPHGLVTDYYETADRRDEYAVRKEKDKAKGGILGIQYQYRVSPSYSVGALGLTNQTYMLSGGFNW